MGQLSLSFFRFVDLVPNLPGVLLVGGKFLAILRLLLFDFFHKLFEIFEIGSGFAGIR